MFIGEVPGVAGADDLRTWVVSQEPGDERNRRAMRLQRSRRQIDDQPLGLAKTGAFELAGHDLEVPVARELGSRIEFHEAALQSLSRACCNRLISAVNFRFARNPTKDFRWIASLIKSTLRRSWFNPKVLFNGIALEHLLVLTLHTLLGDVSTGLRWIFAILP